MLTLVIKASDDYWDPVKEEFVLLPEVTIQLEHSLLSMSCWESKWKVAFYSMKEKTNEQILDYIRCMTLNDIPPDTYMRLTPSQVEEIKDYILDDHTASHVPSEKTSGGPKETPTSELIYYWMTALNIPFQPCESWNLGRLMSLIKVCSYKNTPPKKRPAGDILRDNAELNKIRRQRLHTKG